MPNRDTALAPYLGTRNSLRLVNSLLHPRRGGGQQNPQPAAERGFSPFVAGSSTTPGHDDFLGDESHHYMGEIPTHSLLRGPSQSSNGSPLRQPHTADGTVAAGRSTSRPLAVPPLQLPAVERRAASSSSGVYSDSPRHSSAPIRTSLHGRANGSQSARERKPLAVASTPSVGVGQSHPHKLPPPSTRHPLATKNLSDSSLLKRSSPPRNPSEGGQRSRQKGKGVSKAPNHVRSSSDVELPKGLNSASPPSLSPSTSPPHLRNNPMNQSPLSGETSSRRAQPPVLMKSNGEVLTKSGLSPPTRPRNVQRHPRSKRFEEEFVDAGDDLSPSRRHEEYFLSPSMKQQPFPLKVLPCLICPSSFMGAMGATSQK